MSTPFISEIRIFSFNFAPRGWAMCNGQILQIQQNQALFSLLGTTYGGNGQTTFALPNLQGRVPLHFGSGLTLGQVGGEVNHTLITSEMPVHIHTAQGSKNLGDAVIPVGSVLGQIAEQYGPPSSTTTLLPAAVTNTGGSQPHPNMQPYLVLNICIALQGIFPSQN